MCGAFSILHPFKEIGRHYNAGYNETYPTPRYNIRPSQPIPVVLNTKPEEISFAIWGVHPFYDKTGKMFFINARNDSLNKPTWRNMLQEQRCLIPADGFYEWKKTNKKNKIPYRFELTQKQIFSFAGLWQEEIDSQGHKIPHCVIITTEPNAIVSDVHDRMPAILTKKLESAWLNPDLETDQLIELLVPLKTGLKKYQISNSVNSVKNDFKEIIQPV